MIHLSLGGNEILVLNDAKDAEELLNRRSSNYSSRKQLMYAGKHQSKDKRLVLMHYGDELRKQRAAFHAMLQPRVLSTYEAVQDRESLRFLNNMLDNPPAMQLHSKLYAASIVFALGYGKDLNAEGLKELHELLDIADKFISDCMPGAHLVDLFPALDFLPDIVSPWRSEARKKHENDMKLYGRLFEQVKERSEKLGSAASECFASRVWEEKDKHLLDMTSMTYLVGTALEAGTDSTAAAIIWFVVAVILNPEALAKAQEELDSVVGADGTTMPVFANMDDLPYCFALVKEVLRWHPSAPIGFNHLSDKDDSYNGYFIPANTMVIPNIYTMHRNEEVYPEATKFRPERYLKDLVRPITAAAMSEGHYAFGFGRRVCPGKVFAAQTIWIGMIRLMWAFNFEHARDQNGEIIPIDDSGSPKGLISRAEEFPFKMTPRSATHAETLRREWSEVQHQR